MAFGRAFFLLLWLPNAAAGAGTDDDPGIERARLYGNLNAYAYYFTDLLVGSPQEQLTSVIIDTGSHMLAFPCGGCDHCGEHLEPAIDIGKSATAKWMPCGPKPACDSCSAHGRCEYQERYSEGSSITGHWFEDYVKLGDVVQENPPVKMRMGCHNSENKLFYTQRANGIMGLAPLVPGQQAPVTNMLQELFRDKKHVNTFLFSICLADWGGLLSVGGPSAEYHTGSIQWIPMTMMGYYVLQPERMMLDEGRLVTTGAADFGRAVIDTGTTLTYFPSVLYKALITAIDAYCVLPDNCKAVRLAGHPSCWLLKGPVSQANFPTIKIKFRLSADNEEVDWRPEMYLSKRIRNKEFCYAFAPMSDNIGQTILGISWLLHKDAIFDVANQRFGIVDANCPQHHKIPTSLWELLANPSWLLQSRLVISWPLIMGVCSLLIGLIGFRAWRTMSAVSKVTPAESPESRSLL